MNPVSSYTRRRTHGFALPFLMVFGACEGQIRYHQQDAPFLIYPAQLDSAEVGRRYRAVLRLEPDPVQAAVDWSLDGAPPPGLLLQTTGEVTLEGVPSQVGLFSFALRAEFEAEAGSVVIVRDYQLLVEDSSTPSITWMTQTLPSGRVNQPYRQELRVQGAAQPLTWSVTSGELPAGLNLTSQRAAAWVEGIPTVSGASNFSIAVQDARGAAKTQSLSLSVASQEVEPLLIGQESWPRGVVASPYFHTLVASGGTGEGYDWQASGLPSGLQVSSEGVVHGTPAMAGVSSIDVRVRDSGDQQASWQTQLTIETSTINQTPAWVAIGHGFRSTSCDDGRTWQADWYDRSANDHSRNASFGGLAFGFGRFIQGTGWGPPGDIYTSTDGLGFTRLGEGQFVVDGQPETYSAPTSAVVFSGDAFILFGEYSAGEFWHSLDGLSWTRENPMLPPTDWSHIRQARGLGNQIVLAMDTGASSWLLSSLDGGESYTTVQGYVQACGQPIQHYGDVHAVGGRMYVGSSRLCRSDDGGRTWNVLPASQFDGNIRDLADDGDAVLVLTDSTLYRSTDGEDFDVVSRFEAAMGSLTRWQDNFVAVSRDLTTSYRSTDGQTWTEGGQPGGGDGLYVRDFVVASSPLTCR